MTALDRAFVRLYQETTASPVPVPLPQVGEPARVVARMPHEAVSVAAAENTMLSPPPLSDDPDVLTTASPIRALMTVQAIGSETFCFQPMLQVDRFAWPGVVRRLLESCSHQMDQMAEGIEVVVAGGRKVLGVSGCRRGEGATTILLAMARRLAQRGMHVLVIDADQTDAQVGQRLGLLPEAGWQEAVTGRAALEDVVVESADDRVDVLPAREPFAGAGMLDDDQSRVERIFATCREAYDAVLIDVGPLEGTGLAAGSLAPGIAQLLDGVVLVHDNRSTSKKRIQEFCFGLRTAGIPQCGIVENFVRAA